MLRAWPRPGSLPWLLRHELRLAWRDATANVSGRTLGLVVAALVVALHLVAWSIMRPLGPLPAGPVSGGVALVAGLLFLGALPLVVVMGVNRSVSVLFERHDLDLLASSPLRPAPLFASRVLSVAAQLAVVLGLVLLPVGNVSLFLGQPRLLGVYPVLVTFALLGANLGALATLALVRWLGARRARTASQLLATALLAGLFLAGQLEALLSGLGLRLEDDSSGKLQELFAAGGPLGPASPVWFPGRAFFLDPLAVLVVLGASLGLTRLSIAVLHGTFMKGTRQASSHPGGARRRPTSLRFTRTGLKGLLFLKEWRLVSRDPYLVSQLLLPLVYAVPIALLWQRDSAFGAPTLGAKLVGLVAWLSAVIAGSLTRIMVSGEEAPDLIRSAPLEPGVVTRVKLAAALLPVWLLALVLLAFVARTSPSAAGLGALGTGASSFTAALLRLKNRRPAPRKDLFKRSSSGDPILNLLEGLSGLAGLAFVASVGSGFIQGWWLSLAFPVLLAVGHLYTERRAEFSGLPGTGPTAPARSRGRDRPPRAPGRAGSS